MDSMRARVWWARASLGLVVLAAIVLLAFAGRRGIWLVLVTVGTVVVVAAAGFWFLQQRGVLRWLALALAIGAPLVMLGVFVAARLLWVAVLAAGLLVAAGLAAGTALRPDRSAWALPVVDAPDAERPFVVMNPRSGGGKVGRFDLQQRAEALGVEVALIDKPGTDVQQLARDALARGADLLGVAGGDGTQALVAQVAAEHDVPFLVISAGTRNHFALDLGLDREDPSRCLDALRDGVEARIDLGEINGRTFVNNASFGAYAEIVENPAYRNDKRGTTLDALPDLLSGRRGAHLVADADGLAVDGPQALLVSNGPYDVSRPGRDGPAAPAGPRRAGCDRRPGGHRPAGGAAAARRPPPGDAADPGAGGAGARRGTHRAGRHRRRDGAAGDPGALHHPPGRAAGAAAPPAARRAPTAGRDELAVTVAAGRRPPTGRRPAQPDRPPDPGAAGRPRRLTRRRGQRAHRERELAVRPAICCSSGAVPAHPLRMTDGLAIRP